MNESEKREVEHDVYVSLREHFVALRAEDQRRLDERFASIDKALVLQAKEYHRRLHELNGSFERDRARQHDYVTEDKWAAANEAEKTSQEAALTRVNEKFDEYIKRYEARQRDVDLLLAAQQGAADEAKRAVEMAVRQADQAAREQGRRQSRNLGLASIGLTIIIFAANIIPPLVK